MNVWSSPLFRLVNFPLWNSGQGGWENDETVKEAAMREAVEEAGVRGDLKVNVNKFVD